MTQVARRLRHIGLNVSDLQRAVAFYCDTLGFVELERTASAQVLVFGAERIELTIPETAGAPYPADSTAADLWFQHFAIVVPDMAAAYARLQHHRTGAITHGGPVRLPAASGGVTAYKFRDPDGHPLELIAFPAAAGPGIDHSALSVADADRSIAFYTQKLGLKLGHRQTNHGPEQDRLDGLAGVLVDVVALLPPDGATPHVELLGYRTPTGRRAPPGPNDIAASRLVFEGDAGSPTVVRDPDGHLLMLMPPSEP